MTSMDIIWDYFIQNNPKNGFLHDLSWFQASPKVLSKVNSMPSQFFQTLLNFLGFCSQTLLISIGNIFMEF